MAATRCAGCGYTYDAYSNGQCPQCGSTVRKVGVDTTRTIDEVYADRKALATDLVIAIDEALKTRNGPDADEVAGGASVALLALIERIVGVEHTVYTQVKNR
jgi:hypothetical protein